MPTKWKIQGRCFQTRTQSQIAFQGGGCVFSWTVSIYQNKLPFFRGNCVQFESRQAPPLDMPPGRSWLSQFQACPFPWAFVILFCKSCKCPTVGLKSRVQLLHPGTTPKLNFPVNKLQIPYLWEISNNLIKLHVVPYANRPQPLGIFIAKTITSI